MWAVVQLREQSDPIAVEVLERDLAMRWPEATFKFPAVKQGVLDRANPLSSYVFAQPPSKALPSRLEASPYVQRVLRDPARRVQYVSDAELQVMVEPTLLPAPGTQVRVTSGDWSGMQGTVVDQTADTDVVVLIELWSRKSLVTLASNEFVEV